MDSQSGMILLTCNQSGIHKSFNILYVQMKQVNVYRSLMLPHCIGELKHFKANSFYSSSDTMLAFVVQKKLHFDL